MTTIPEFPRFKEVELEDLDFLQDLIWEYQPNTSEINFTNLFVWSFYYGYRWSMYQDWLIVISTANDEKFYALQPIGPSQRKPVVKMILEWMHEENDVAEPYIDRAGIRLIKEIEGSKSLAVEAIRDHFDYISKTEDLIQLPGQRYQLSRDYTKNQTYQYTNMESTHISDCLARINDWYVHSDLNLLNDKPAVVELLNNFGNLAVKGGVLTSNGQVEAFILGEMLNDSTVVIHFEKANPHRRGLYAMINQQFCLKNWRNISFINREQDFGEPKLRATKTNFFHDTFMKKYRIRLEEDENYE